ncbi:MAG: helix-turn-helix transcriptional regulator [Christensenellales bacterium]
MPISRLFRLLYILLERERVPAPELAQTLEVSVRTIYRDVQTLGEAGIPVYAERGRDGGVAILPTLAEQIDGQRRRKQDMLAALQALASTGASDWRAGQTERFFRRQADGLGAHRLCGLSGARRLDPRAESGHPESSAAHF